MDDRLEIYLEGDFDGAQLLAALRSAGAPDDDSLELLRDAQGRRMVSVGPARLRDSEPIFAALVAFAEAHHVVLRVGDEERPSAHRLRNLLELVRRGPDETLTPAPGAPVIGAQTWSSESTYEALGSGGDEDDFPWTLAMGALAAMFVAAWLLLR